MKLVLIWIKTDGSSAEKITEAKTTKDNLIQIIESRAIFKINYVEITGGKKEVNETLVTFKFSQGFSMKFHERFLNGFSEIERRIWF